MGKSKTPAQAESIVKLYLVAGEAKPAPPVGTILGPRKVPLMPFCKQFNDESLKLVEGNPTLKGLRLVVTVRVKDGGAFEFSIGAPPTTELLKKYSNIAKGSSATKKEGYIGEISLDACKQVAKLKMDDMKLDDPDAALRCVIGSAESMGLKVEKVASAG